MLRREQPATADTSISWITPRNVYQCAKLEMQQEQRDGLGAVRRNIDFARLRSTSVYDPDKEHDEAIVKNYVMC